VLKQKYCSSSILGKWDIEVSNHTGLFISPKLYALKCNVTGKETIKGKGIPEYLIKD
jgi:hypothetical protein